jgi:CRP-like cAMP-binding protein
LRSLFKWTADKDKEPLLDILAQVSLFNGLNRKLLRKLLIDLIPKEYEAGEVIFSELDIGKALYIVVDGTVKIAKEVDGNEKTLARLSSGSYFGELALINQTPRFASAVAETRSNLLIMYKSYFDDLIRSNNAISSRILLNLTEALSFYICKSQSTENIQTKVISADKDG